MIVLRRKQFGMFFNSGRSVAGLKNWFQGRGFRSMSKESATKFHNDWATKAKEFESNGMSSTQAAKQADQLVQKKDYLDLNATQTLKQTAKGLGNTALIAGGTAVGAGALGIGAVNSMTGGVGKAVTGGMGDENSHGY